MDTPGFAVSPFRVKGALYLGTQSFFAKQAVGLDAVCAALRDPRLRDFIRQRFQPTSAYEVMHVPALIDAEARALGLTHDVYLLERSRFQASLDTSGIYRLLLRLTSPETVIERVPHLITQLFNFGEGATTELGKRERRVVIDGIPSALVPWLSVATRIYIETIVLLAGASTCAVTPVRVGTSPSQDGYTMCSLTSEISWT